MTGAVESVLADAVLLVELHRDGVEVGLRGHGLVELRVEDGDVRDAGEDLLAGFDAAEVGGVVERSQRDALADDVLDRFVDLDRGSDLFAAVQHAVTDGLDFGQALQDADLRIDEFGADRAETVGMVLHAFGGFLELETVRTLDDEVRSRGADAFHEAGSDDGVAAAFHIEEGEFEGRTAGVDHKNFHAESFTVSGFKMKISK